MRPDLVLVTCASPPTSETEHELLLREWTRLGVQVEVVSWDRPEYDWSQPRAALIRSTWDYFHRREEFLTWVERTGQLTSLWNPPQVIRWNTDKRYLLGLQEAQVPVVPTVRVEQGAPVPELETLMRVHGWDELVVKPSISAGAWKTGRFTRSRCREAQLLLTDIVASGAALLQPYLREVERRGERSLIWIDGQVTHAVRRKPMLAEAPLEVERVEPDDDERARTDELLERVPGPLLYARADWVRDDAGALRLMELEVTEPFLFFKLGPGSAGRLAKAVALRL